MTDNNRIETMRILEVIFSLSPGGAERLVVDISNQMVKNGHNVKILTLQGSYIPRGNFYEEELDRKVKREDLGLRNLKFINLFELYKAISNEHADIVHLHLGTMPFWCVLPILFYKKSQYVVTQHILADKEKEKGGIAFWTKYLLCKLKLIHVVSIGKDNKDSVKRIYGTDSEMIINGRDVKSVKPCSLTEDDFKIYRNKVNSIVVINVARCSPQKNQKRLISCINNLNKNGKNVVLLILGDGYDSKLGKELKEMAGNNIYFLGPKHNVFDYYKNADLFCLSSDYEGMPITLIEAMSCGCVPVGTPCSGFNDIIKNGVNGFVSKEITDESFYETMTEAVNNVFNIDRDAIKKEFNEKYTAEICAQQYISLFTQLTTHRIR